MRSIRTHARRPIVLVSIVATLLSLVLLPASGANAAPSLADAEKQLNALGVKMDTINEQVNSANVQLKRVQAQQAGLNRQLSASRAKLDVSQGEVGKIAAAAYRDGGMRMSSSLLTSGSPGRFLDQLAALEWLSGRQRETIRLAKADQSQYDDAKTRVDLQVQSVSTLQTQLSSRKALINKDMARWEQIRRSAYTAKYGTAGSTTVLYNGQASGNAGVVVRFALAQQGKPYVFGAAGPDSFDCSGLTEMAWAQVGVSLPHASFQQQAMIRAVARADLEPGDLVFSYGGEHVGIYIGNNEVVHAPTTGDVVKVSSIDVLGFSGAGRP